MRPEHVTLEGRYCSIVPLAAAAHAGSLWEAVRGSENDHLWTYLFDGPYATAEAFAANIAGKAASRDPLFFAILVDGVALGHAALMRIEPAHRVVEVGSILYAPALQRTRAATEAMYLMARYAFDTLGYRRYEWKCDSRNAPSRRAALRFGFSFEGIFRQHMLVKGQNRDTAWYAMLDTEWPARKAEFERWLAPGNFDAAGGQKTPLAQSSISAS